jgi:hypothetical protein
LVRFLADGVRFRTDGIAMDKQTIEWKRTVDRLWSAESLDYAQGARLVAEIARSEEPALQRAAAQALPGLRSACQKGADRTTRERARRRLSAVRDVLHALDAPRFGKRISALSPQDLHRKLLGLPPGRHLSGAEIRDAYKRVAKTRHPDAGGTDAAFRELSEARDALLREV